MKAKGSPKGGACRSVCVVLTVAMACLVMGYMAGKVYMDGVNGRKMSVSFYIPGTGLRMDTSGGSGAQPTTGSSASAAPKKSGPVASVCTDTCASAGDGVCDEGRWDSSTPADIIAGSMQPAHFVKCDLGTDCKDCGTWQPLATPHWVADSRIGPVEHLRSNSVEVRVKSTMFTIDDKPFKFAYTDPQKDLDVSSNMEARRSVEYGITKVFHKIFKSGCRKPDGSRGLFLDVGSNFGWFSVLAAVMGCRVIAYEPVPLFRAFLEYNVHVNGLEHLVEIRKNVVSHQHGVEMKMVVPTGGIWGTAGIDGLNIDKSAPGAVQEIKVGSVALDKSVDEEVLLMKVDVEGWEWSVMQGAQALLAKHPVHNIIMEYSPGVPERNHKMPELAATVRMLQDILARGYKVAHIDDKDALTNPSLDAPLPAMEEVTEANLRYDARDVELLSTYKLGCPMPQEWTGRFCGASTPEDLSPRSLRAMFGHNTNLWASKSPGLQTLQGRVGLLDVDDPPDKFFITRTFNDGPQQHLMGLGWRRCSDMDPQWQVRHRCPCTKPEVCGAEEAMVLAAAKEGRIGSNYILN